VWFLESEVFDPVTMGDGAGPGALAGLRILDLTQALAGPYCTQILGDLGAEIVKVEALGKGDGTRGVGPFRPADKERRYSGYYQSVNRNKKSIAVDLKSEGGRELILDLLNDYDIVVENFRVGTLEKLGLSYEVMKERNPRLIYAAIRGFGDPRTGESPYVTWPAFDVVAQAMGGIAGVTGPADEPTKVGPGVGDTVPGMFLAIGILAAVVNRSRTGEGQFVDVGMADAILALSERIVYQLSFGGIVPKGTGNHQPFMGPFGFFPAKDGYIALATSPQNFFEAMCKAIESEDLLADERFNTMEGRQINLKELIPAVSERLVRFTKAELHERLGGLVPFGPVYDMAEIAADPHFKVRGMLPEIELKGLGEKVAVAGSPIRMTRTPPAVRTAGPDLGEHTYDVLTAHGYSEERIAALKENGAIAYGPDGSPDKSVNTAPKEAVG
jgi:crotonobetainyl-CoA:carnitine CoA-transferase CaiB-like acyl-CoA transferase